MKDIAKKSLEGYEERVKEIFKDHLRELQNTQIERLTIHELLEEIDKLNDKLNCNEFEYSKAIRDSVIKVIEYNRKLQEKD